MRRKKKKTYKKRGSRTCGGGSAKNRKGAGNRGGRGNAGSGKRARHKYTPGHLGKRGFTRPPKLKKDEPIINLRYINNNIDRLLEEGVAVKKDDEITVNVSKLGATKVLGKGHLTQKFSVKADNFSEGAKTKIEAMGGEAITGDIDV